MPELVDDFLGHAQDVEADNAAATRPVNLVDHPREERPRLVAGNDHCTGPDAPRLVRHVQEGLYVARVVHLLGIGGEGDYDRWCLAHRWLVMQ